MCKKLVWSTYGFSINLDMVWVSALSDQSGIPFLYRTWLLEGFESSF